MKTIKWKDIYCQVKADLIGKDSYRGVTLSYSWLANQFGHFSLGYIPTLIAYSILKKCNTFYNPAFRAALIISLIWLLFELYNFLGPLLSNKKSSNKLLFISSGNKYVFQPDWRNVGFDTLTDLCFFWFGAFSASLFLWFSWTTIFILLTLSVVLIYPISYWFITKMYIQLAKLPIQFRLSQWEGDLAPNDKKSILKFLNSKDNSSGNHLLIFGGRGSGKSSLSIGIGTEFSIKRFSCSYFTAMKLFGLLSLSNEKIVRSNKCDVWSWRSANLLIIDDINPGNPISNILISPELFLNIIRTPVEGDTSRNSRELKNKNLIWILGDDGNDLIKVNNWREMLLKIGVSKNKIFVVNLGSNIT